MKIHIRYGSLALLIAIALFSGTVFGGEGFRRVDTPTIDCAGSTQSSINIRVCAGSVTGAPAGFTIQWETLADFQENGWRTFGDPALCKAWFWKRLAPGECTTVTIGESLFDTCPLTNCKDPLECGTDYIFRAFAHPTKIMFRSYPTPNLTCSTLPCNGQCALTQGYWKKHNPTVCTDDPSSPLCVAWPATSLTLGTVNYSVPQLVEILNTPASGNGLIILVHQLIAAKLNIENGADGSAIAALIASADAIINGLVVPPVGLGTLAPSATSELADALMNFNEGQDGGACR